MEWFFTADEHYYHKNIIKYSDRPFKNIDEMNKVLIDRHNEVVLKKDTVVHAGDICFGSPKRLLEILQQLNGNHILLMGSHDVALKRIVKKSNYAEKKYENLFMYRGRRLETKINGKFVVIDHYCLRTWPLSHYNSWHLYGHSHGKLEPIGKSWDIGVDANNYYPVSFARIHDIMQHRPDNPNFIPSELRRRN